MVQNIFSWNLSSIKLPPQVWKRGVNTNQKRNRKGKENQKTSKRKVTQLTQNIKVELSAVNGVFRSRKNWCSSQPVRPLKVARAWTVSQILDRFSNRSRNVKACSMWDCTASDWYYNVHHVVPEYLLWIFFKKKDKEQYLTR